MTSDLIQTLSAVSNAAAAVAALVVSVVALLISTYWARRQNSVSKLANSVPVLVDLFREYREKRLRHAGQFVFNELDNYKFKEGLNALPPEGREKVLDLAFYYDNIGALVVDGVVPADIVIEYLGGSAMFVYEKLRPLIEAEREKRKGFPDPDRWQVYFENLAKLAEGHDFAKDRSQRKEWRLGWRGPSLPLVQDIAVEHTTRQPPSEAQSKD